MIGLRIDADLADALDRLSRAYLRKWNVREARSRLGEQDKYLDPMFARLSKELEEAEIEFNAAAVLVQHLYGTLVSVAMKLGEAA